MIRAKIALFCEFVDHNASYNNVEFVAGEKYADEFQMRRDVSTIFYRNGNSTNFEIPSRPGQPQATRISFPNITLHWSKPSYGSRSIQHYKIFGRIMSTKQWQSVFTTADATPTATITNLIKGKYQFRTQGVTIAGDTAESIESKIIGWYLLICALGRQ